MASVKHAASAVSRGVMGPGMALNLVPATSSPREAASASAYNGGQPVAFVCTSVLVLVERACDEVCTLVTCGAKDCGDEGQLMAS